MGYELTAVIGNTDQLRTVVGDLPHALLVPLHQGLSLIPVTDRFFDAVTDGSAASRLDFWRLPAGFELVLADWSQLGPVAYVEAEYFGGVGEQRSAVWHDSQIVLGPLQTNKHEPFPIAGSPISQALRELGARTDGTTDEFTAVGLHQHRHTDDWATNPTAPETPSPDQIT